MKTNTLIGTIATIAITLLSSTAMAWGGSGHRWGPGVVMGYGGMTIFWIVVIIAVAGIVCFAIYLSRRSARNKKKESLLNILSEQYTRGEITKEEFESKKQNLREDAFLDNLIQIDTLLQRYARGEITKEEFDRRKQGLRDDAFLEILIPRYASGEITKEEFERIKKDMAG